MTGNIADIIVVLILIILVGASVFYIRKQKKKGVHCIGCPSAGACTGACKSKMKKEK